jgi:murein DD-endopeptidase MepM/ murein hydrolase activator NlpD
VSSCGGLVKKHNGTDYSATAGWPVYAAEDGVVRKIVNGTGDGFGYAIVLEHNHPVSGKYTTVSWHVNPLVAEGDFIPKGMQIATVAHIDPKYGDHYHLGVRIGAYQYPFSYAGGLPQTSCVINNITYPAFPEYFVNPEDSTKVLFQ